ncbi:MAG: wax ester/triacylglycerol synthase family O-acyltransferase [Thermoanaerobaculia bacterium]
MKQLSGLDSAFLYLETDNAPMHIGGVSILDPRTPDGRFTLDTLRRVLAARLHRSRTFTERLASVPLNLGKPYWIEDESFDLERHLERTQLPEPGGWRELSALTAWELGQLLPRDRPLWKMLLVEGVDGIEGVPPGSVAIIGRIHHAAIDGVSGSELLSALFDLTPEPVAARPGAPQPGAPQPGAPQPDDLAEAAAAPAESSGKSADKPSGAKLLGRSGKNLIGIPKAIPGTVGETVKALIRSGAVWGLKKVKPPPLPFTAPRTRLNVPLSGERVWSPALLSLDRIKAIRKAAGGTVNDVVLAICAGALRHYLEDKEDLPEKPLVAMVPVSVRAEDERGTMGNKVSAMLVSLATDEDDPAVRLRKIRDSTTDSKIHHQAIGARTLSDVGEFIPFALAGVATRLYTRMHLADKLKPIFNLVITNVPGPQVPLYVGGAKLLVHVGFAPIFDGVGLILPIFSYAGTLAIGATSDRCIMPDLDVFTRHLETSLDELEQAVGRIDTAAGAGSPRR